ncbi:MAG: 16S rRNA (cytosine(967)-C(5))-methyltransferase RsmB [Lachnospiraceae bacterium]|nr:16S rRNA (cytosine(967)-C(5))-methyltransferase RsmB [Lachnospiraceae bacterium]
MGSKGVNLREASLDTILEFEKTKAKSDELIHRFLDSHGELTGQEKRFYMRLTKGCIGQLIKLDAVISFYSDTPVNKLRPVIRNILRISAYQLFEMDGVPERAVVSEAVKLARKRGFSSLTGFVNAVLRKMAAEPGRVKLPGKDEPVRYLNIRYSMPEYLAEKWLKRYGLDTAEKICAAFLDERPVTVRLVRTGRTAEETLQELQKAGVSAEKAPCPENAFFLKNTPGFANLAASVKGGLFVQDLSSQLAVHAAGIRKGGRVLDVCAAPGGKSLLAADILDGTGLVVSRDLTEEKVSRINENIQRLGFANIKTEVYDAEVYDKASEKKFDVVLADLPCSGYGVIGRKPDIKYSASEEKERSLAALQKRILDNACRYVKPGGILLFSTCTVSETENEENVTAFLKDHPEFRPDPLDPYLPEELRCEESGRGMLQILPDEIKDGFFIARFVNGYPVDDRG